MYCLETQQLSHRFAASGPVLNNMHLQVREGSIYGFLGPNGAGKTTTLRLALGLLKKQQGRILIFGKDLAQHRIDILKRTGSLIESPSLYSQLTALENLAVFQKLYHCPKSRMQEVLQLVGLGQTGNKKAGRFSLGMKQRLGIAIALLHNPALLVLDEPTNGLDPSGIIEMRALLKQLNRDQGLTILISSHLLSEIEKLATHVGVIHKGSLLFQGSLEELMKRQQSVSSVILETGGQERALALAKQLVPGAALREEKIFLPAVEKEMVAELNRRLVSEGIAVYSLSPGKNDLESIFMDLTATQPVLQ